MRMAMLSLTAAALIATAAAVLMVPVEATARAKLQEAGEFNCSCDGGAGTCTFKSSGDNMSCYKGASDTCSGSCMLTTTPDKTSGGAAAIKRGGAKTMKGGTGAQ
jgi:hypothetical protein